MTADLIQPIVLLVDKTNPASQTDGIRAVALAAAQHFFAEIAAWKNMDLWQTWFESSDYAKTVRRANRSTFDKLAGDPSGHPVTVGDAAAIAFTPVDSAAMPKPLAVLQVSGTILPETPSTAPAADHAPTIVLNASLGMSTGKAAAQAAHALVDHSLETTRSPRDCAIIWRDEPEFEKGIEGGLSVIRDAGRTEIAAGSVTAYIER